MITMPNGKTVFIIEDDSTVQFLLKMYLNGQWDVESSYSAEDAYTRLEKSNPDIVLTDYHLPGKNGMDVFRDFRNRLPETRFVMMTSAEDASIQQTAMDIGFDLFLKKPLKRSTLLSNLEELAA